MLHHIALSEHALFPVPDAARRTTDGDHRRFDRVTPHWLEERGSVAPPRPVRSWPRPQGPLAELTKPLMDTTVQLIEAEIPRLRRYARYLTRDVEQADDLVQECLTRALSKLDTWQPGTNLRAWLFVILRNVHISEARRNSRSVTAAAVEADHPGLAVSGNQESRLALRELQRAVEALSEEHREVLHLVAVEGLKYEEAAVVLEIPVGTVRSRLSRARMALRLFLEGKVVDQGQGAA